jgi:hypothetical protein
MVRKGWFVGRSIARPPEDLLLPVATQLLPHLTQMCHPAFPPMPHFAEDSLTLVANHLLRWSPPTRQCAGLSKPRLSEALPVILLPVSCPPVHPPSCLVHWADPRLRPETRWYLHRRQRCQLSHKRTELSPPPTFIPEIIVQRGSFLYERGRHGAAGVYGIVISVQSRSSPWCVRYSCWYWVYMLCCVVACDENVSENENEKRNEGCLCHCRLLSER